MTSHAKEHPFKSKNTTIAYILKIFYSNKMLIKNGYTVFAYVACHLP